MLCEDCQDKVCLKVSNPRNARPCRDVENYLNRKVGKEGYSMRHIRRKEIPYTHEGLEIVEKINVNKEAGIKNKYK